MPSANKYIYRLSSDSCVGWLVRLPISSEKTHLFQDHLCGGSEQALERARKKRDKLLEKNGVLSWLIRKPHKKKPSEIPLYQ